MLWFLNKNYFTFEHFFLRFPMAWEPASKKRKRQVSIRSELLIRLVYCLVCSLVSWIQHFGSSSQALFHPNPHLTTSFVSLPTPWNVRRHFQFKITAHLPYSLWKIQKKQNIDYLNPWELHHPKTKMANFLKCFPF